jgi:II/X family phage/plasmid replication protein
MYDTGRVVRLSPGGEIQLETSNIVTVEGSHDSRLVVRSSSGHDLYISGNPTKHFQGHNLFGSCDPLALYFAAGWRIREAVGLFPSEQTWEALGFTGPRFTRIDLTRSYRFATAADARAFLRDSAATARSRHGGAIVQGTTVYFGKTSERWTFKCYHKGDEIASKKKGHALAYDLPQRKELIEWADGVVRFELTLRSKELEKLSLATSSPLTVWQTYFDRITWNRNAAMSQHDDLLTAELPPLLLGVLALWRQGADLRQIYPQNTFYRHRRALLERVGVDIASPPSEEAPAAPDSGQLLDPKGWDPEPLKGHAWQPDILPFGRR